MGRLVTYLVNFDKIEINTVEGDLVEVAKKIHPERCFDKPYEAQKALRGHYKKLRDVAQENVKKSYLVIPK
jgi:hypothetical protein